MIRPSAIILALALCTAAIASPRFAKDMPARALPLTISSVSSNVWAVEGKFLGTYQVHPDYIEVNFQTASIQLMGSASNQRARLITDITIGLAESTGGNTWRTLKPVTLATPDQVMQVGAVLKVTPQPVRIPITASLDLSKRWVVVEITNTFVDSKNPEATKTRVCYAHSTRNLFVNAR